jgi:SHS2 domain-containing protein
MQSTYHILDHTADLRIRITGADRSDLFKNAGLALFDLIADTARVEADAVIEFTVGGSDSADLLVNYLREMLFLWTGEEQLVKTIEILHITNTAVSARATVGRYQPDRHQIVHEIKAVTYHQVDVSRTEQGWQARVIFDI